MNEGFVDLRQNQAQMVDESFWPSFTDIMTVVVMIFLIATSVLIVKNWELVNELQTRIKVEQKISQRLKASMAAQKKTSQELLETQDKSNKISQELIVTQSRRDKISQELLDSQNKRDKISQKLQLSIEAEHRTTILVQKTSKEKASLNELLTQAQSRISLMRLQLMQARESATERDYLIIEQEKQITQMINNQTQLEQNINNLDNKLSLAKKQLIVTKASEISLQGKLDINTQALVKREQALKAQLVELSGKDKKLDALSQKNQRHLENILNYERQVTAIQEKNSLLSGELEDQQTILADKDKELENLNVQNQTYLDNISQYEHEISLAEQEHSNLSSEYDSLEDKYNELIKPSRSAVGKQVVEVRYEISQGSELIRFRPSDNDPYQAISESDLHKKLLKLKEQYGKTLYVKIIIPDDSGLSYNEAWSFMMGILEKYDYYYQD